MTRTMTTKRFMAAAPLQQGLGIGDWGLGRAKVWRRPRACRLGAPASRRIPNRSEEHTSELQSLMRISYAVFCLKKKTAHSHQPISMLFRSHPQYYTIIL